MDEMDFSVNKEPWEVIIEKGIKTLPNVTSAEKGEHVITVGACDAEGRFLPAVVILKGMYKK
jgi:hypothetical protein